MVRVAGAARDKVVGKAKGVASKRRVRAEGKAVPNLHLAQAADRRTAVWLCTASLPVVPVAGRCLRYTVPADVAGKCRYSVHRQQFLECGSLLALSKAAASRRTPDLNCS